MKNIERIGKFAGETLGKVGLSIIESKIDKFEVRINGIDNLTKLKGHPYLLLANHIKPKEKAAQQSGLSPDALIFKRIIKESTNRDLAVVAKSDDGWWSESKAWKTIQKKVLQPLGKGFHRGIGTLPIKKNPGSFNRDFVEYFEAEVKAGRPILMFPEGNWYPDFEADHKLEQGPAVLAKKYNLPIVPAYINGGDSWEGEQKININFGENFLVEGMSKEEVVEKIREQILDLKARTEIK